MFNGVTQSIRLIGLSFQSLVLTRMKHVIINHNKGIYRLTIDYIYIYISYIILYYQLLTIVQLCSRVSEILKTHQMVPP